MNKPNDLNLIHSEYTHQLDISVRQMNMNKSHTTMKSHFLSLSGLTCTGYVQHLVKVLRQQRFDADAPLFPKKSGESHE